MLPSRKHSFEGATDSSTMKYRRLRCAFASQRPFTLPPQDCFFGTRSFVGLRSTTLARRRCRSPTLYRPLQSRGPPSSPIASTRNSGGQAGLKISRAARGQKHAPQQVPSLRNSDPPGSPVSHGSRFQPWTRVGV